MRLDLRDLQSQAFVFLFFLRPVILKKTPQNENALTTHVDKENKAVPPDLG